MQYWVDSGLERIGALLLPPRCVLCGGPGQSPCLDLCRDCESDLPPARPAILPDQGPLRLSFAPYGYEPPLDHLVHALKYRGQLAVARVLGNLLGAEVESLGLQHDVDVLVPVPLHAARHAERGCNQSYEIARWAGRRLHRPIDARLVQRRRDTRPQVGLGSAERRTNLAGAFVSISPVRRLRVALVDDVTTTGTTLQELGTALLEAGASSVVAWCVGRAAAAKQVNSRCDTEDPSV
jgi:ComF family protein